MCHLARVQMLKFPPLDVMQVLRVSNQPCPAGILSGLMPNFPVAIIEKQGDGRVIKRRLRELCSFPHFEFGMKKLKVERLWVGDAVSGTYNYLGISLAAYWWGWRKREKPGAGKPSPTTQVFYRLPILRFCDFQLRAAFNKRVQSSSSSRKEDG